MRWQSLTSLGGHRRQDAGGADSSAMPAPARAPGDRRAALAGCLRAAVCLPFLLAFAGAQESSTPAEPSAATLEAARRSDAAATPDPEVEIRTSMGSVVVQLDPSKAPVTVANFLKYVDDGHYDGTVMHRVVAGAVIQGGGFAKEGDTLVEKATLPAIKSEADNGLKNAEGTIAMARSDVPDTATAQFFINCRDNEVLDQTATVAGYAVFGRVIRGLDVVQQINAVRTGTRTLQGRTGSGKLQPVTLKAVPLSDVIIESVRRLPTGQAEAEKPG